MGHGHEHIYDLKILIGPLYVIIAMMFFFEGRKAKSRARKISLGSLIVIFVACDISGYLGPALNWPSAVLVSSHIAVILGCIFYILTNQARQAFSPDD